jgi:hypothetical protein
VISRRTHIFHLLLAATLVVLLASVGLQASPQAVQARPLRQGSIDANPPSVTLAPGGMASTTLTVNNTTGAAQSYIPSAVSATLPGANFSFSFSPIPVTANSSSNVGLDIMVPPGTADGTYPATITMTETGGGPTINRSINIIVQAASPTPTNSPTVTNTVPVSGVSLEIVGDPRRYGDRLELVTFDLRVRNRSSNVRTFNLRLQSTPGGIGGSTVNPSSVTLNPNQDFSFTVQVYANENVAPNTIINIPVYAVDQNDSGVNTTAFVQLFVTVNGQTATPSPTPSITQTSTQTTGPSLTVTPPVCQDAYEPDNDMGSAKLIEVNLPQPSTDVNPNVPTHTICPAGDEDWLYFGGLAGKVYTIDITEMALGIDLSLALYDSEGRMLAFNDDYYNRPAPTPDARNNPQGTDYTNLRPRIQSWTAPYNGIFYIQVRDSAGKGRERAAYSIVLQSESYGPTPTHIHELCEDLFEQDGLPEQARLITSNEIQIAHTLCPAGDADWNYFFAKAGKTYMLFTDTRPYASQSPRGGPVNKDTQAGADTIMFLVDRDGVSLLDFNDDIPGGSSLDSQIEFTPSVDGFYFVQVKNIGDIGNQFIRYDFTLQLCLPGQTDCGRPQSLPATPTLPPVSNGSPSETPADFNLDDTVTPTMTNTQEVLQVQRNDQILVGQYQPPILRFWNYISAIWSNPEPQLAGH